MGKRAVLALVIVIASVVAGCTAREPGTPTSIQGTDSSQPSPTAGRPDKTAVSIPPRPKSLKLDAVDPCALLTSGQQQDLKVDRHHAETSDVEIYHGAKECVFEVSAQAPYYRYYATLITTEGIDAWLTGKRNVDARLVSVGGFAAAEFTLAGQGKNAAPCTTALDVAQGQQLQVVMTSSGKDFTQDQVCQMSEQAAGQVLATLQTLE
ncbi:DUF3558 domain-containing protein [Actinokineospora inagensis]|uniref:DUF3558 domain-containing protein n=1 Tax=Actinokineospora inagensis TaxID=103730 RepID=UPI0004128BF9|nr:DUF3558 domain-containing protein [Actinokineospora inagensis]